MPGQPQEIVRNFLIFGVIICQSHVPLTSAAPAGVQPIAPTNAAGQRHHPLHPFDCLSANGLSPRQLPQSYDSHSAGYSNSNDGAYSAPYVGNSQLYNQNEYRRGGSYGGGSYGIGNGLNQPYGQSGLNYGSESNNGYGSNGYGNGNSDFGGSNYGNRNLGGSGYGSGNFPPSYAYTNNYGQYGNSGYEGPFGGYNTYSQPGISYPPHYSDGQCRDCSADCNLLASTGQCRFSSSTRVLCPLSCGTGCATTGAVGGYSAFNQLTPPLDTPIGGFADGFLPQSSSNIFPESMYMRYQQQPLPFPGGGRDYGGGLGAAGYESLDYYGSRRMCIDSHIQGCVNWAQLGYCNVYPEFMLSYCKVSCGVCRPQIPYAGAIGSYLDGNGGLGYGRQLGSEFGIGGSFNQLGGRFGSFNPSAFNGFDELGRLGGLGGIGFNDPGSDIRLGSPLINRLLFNPKNNSAVLSMDRVGLDRNDVGNAIKNPFQSDSMAAAGKPAIGLDAATAAAASNSGRPKSDGSGALSTRLRSAAVTGTTGTDSDAWRLRGKAFDSINAPRDAPLRTSVVRMDDLRNS